MDLKADIPVYDGPATIDPTLHVHNLTQASRNNYGTNNVLKNKVTSMVKHNFDTPSSNQVHSRQASPHNKNNNTDLVIFHPNIRGLVNKTDELVNSWSTESPHILCLTEHHLHNQEINNTCIQQYNLGAS